MPISTASCAALRRWTCSRLASPVIQRLSPDAVAIRPSREVASLRVTVIVLPPSPARRDGSRALRRQLVQALFAEEAGEVLGLAEVAIDRGVADVGHVIELLQLLHDQFADGRGRQLGLAHALELTHDCRDHPLDPFGLEGALADGDGDRPGKLVAIEGRAAAGALEDGEFAQLDTLEGGEPALAARAKATTTDRRAVFRRSAVLHLGLVVA